MAIIKSLAVSLAYGWLRFYELYQTVTGEKIASECPRACRVQILPGEPNCKVFLSGRLYSAADVARELGVCKMTVLRRASDGRLRRPRLYIRSSSGKIFLWDFDEFSRATTFKKADKR